MALSLLSHEVSDLCIGKPALRALPISATVGEALFALRRCGDTHLSVWASDRSVPEKKACVGKLSMVDILCYLCAPENIASPAAVLQNPVSALLSKESAALVCRVDHHSSILEALKVILEGAHIVLVPIRSAGSSRKKLAGAGAATDFCWLTQEDFVRFFFNSIGFFSAVAALSISQLGLVRTADVLAINHHDSALSALPLIRRALVNQTSVAVITDDRKLIGEISPSTLAVCNESIAPALSALSAGDLMAYMDWCASPPEAAIEAVKSILKRKEMQGMLELMESELLPPLLPPSSSSSDEEEPKWPRRRRSAGSYSARMGRKSEEAIVCYPGSSLVAVIVQALAHRVGYIWVVEEDYSLVGIVAFRDILGVFRGQFKHTQLL